jgi:hypothetical protein
MSGREPDVEIRARVRAAVVRFERTADVELNAHPAPERESERTNLPDDVARDTTYEDIEVRWRLGARLEARQRR